MTNGLALTTPGAGLTGARDLFDRFFEDAFGRAALPTPWGEQGVAAQSWVPRVDISETEDALTVHAEVPGLKKDDVSVSVEDHVLTLSGERRLEKDEKKENYHRIERAYGTFSRSFTLPSNVDAAKAEASFKDGVLRVRIPKSEAARPRKIAIK